MSSKSKKSKATKLHLGRITVNKTEHEAMLKRFMVAGLSTR